MDATPWRARITATLSAALRGREPGLFVLVIAFGGIFIVSLRYVSSTPWAIPGIIVSLLFLSLITLAWLLDRHFAKPTVPVSARALVSGREVALRTEAEPSQVVEILAAFRDTALNIQPLPNPHGKIAGDPSDTGALQEYSEGERRAGGEALRAEAFHHSRQAAEEIARVQRVLISPASEEPERKTRPIPPINSGHG